MKSNDKGFGLVSILIVSAIIAFFVLIMLKNYYMKPAIDKETQKVMSEQGVDTINPVFIVGNARNTIQKAKDKQSDRAEY